jgi:hypothetical protein
MQINNRDIRSTTWWKIKTKMFSECSKITGILCLASAVWSRNFPVTTWSVHYWPTNGAQETCRCCYWHLCYDCCIGTCFTIILHWTAEFSRRGNTQSLKSRRSTSVLVLRHLVWALNSGSFSHACRNRLFIYISDVTWPFYPWSLSKYTLQRILLDIYIYIYIYIHLLNCNWALTRWQ